jgi:ATP-dependent DNA helicase RecG
LNSLIHKDNAQGIPVQIKVFPDRIFIYNVGKLPDQWSIDTLYESHGSKPRNPKVASAMFRTGMIEAWGRGIEKIIKGCRRIDAPDPVFKEIGGDMSVEFLAPEDAIYRPGGQTDEPLNEPVLTAIHNNPQATKEEITRITGLSRATVTRHLQQLRQDGIIERIGSDKTGYWKILR